MYQTTTAAEEVLQKALARADEINAHREDTGELDGFKITAEQCSRINRGERAAVDKFFEDNATRLKRLAKAFLLRTGMPLRWDNAMNCWQPAILEIGDCLNQLYIDMRQGYLVFALVPKIIARVICHSFRYAGVGGFGPEDGAYLKGVKYECS